MVTRRELVGSLSVAGLTGLAAGTGRSSAAPLPPGARVPGFRFVYECVVTLATTLPFGRTLEGTRRVIPLTGGTFRGPRLHGEVLSIGADWNLSRSDGAGSVDAAYYLRTHDDVMIRVVNQGTGERNAAPPKPDEPEHFFMFTTPRFEAPIGAYDWLNRGTFVGTLGARANVHNAVLIRVFEVV